MPTGTNITVGELRELLANFADDWELSFGALHFYRVKVRGEKLVQIEFDESISQDKSGKCNISGSERK